MRRGLLPELKTIDVRDDSFAADVRAGAGAKTLVYFDMPIVSLG